MKRPRCYNTILIMFLSSCLSLSKRASGPRWMPYINQAAGLLNRSTIGCCAWFSPLLRRQYHTITTTRAIKGHGLSFQTLWHMPRKSCALGQFRESKQSYCLLNIPWLTQYASGVGIWLEWLSRLRLIWACIKIPLPKFWQIPIDLIFAGVSFIAYIV